PVPLADAIGRFLHRMGDAIDGLQGAVGRAILYAFNVLFAFVPRRRPQYPRQVLRTAAVEEGRRRRLGMLGMAGVALLLAFGTSVASLPAVSPTQAIPRATVARQAIEETHALMAQVDEEVDGHDLIDRAPESATELLNQAFAAIENAAVAGVRPSALNPLRDRVDAGLDRIYAVARIGEASTLVDLATPFPGISPSTMVAAGDGSLWVADAGRGRLVRIDGRGRAQVVYRAGQAIGELVGGDPWLLATAATDVVLVDRQRQAWRFDLREHTPQPLSLPGLDEIGGRSQLLAALQHRPPLEIFNLYAVDAARDQVLKWSPGDVVPVVYPRPPERFLTEKPDLQPRDARDLFVDVNLWLLQRDTVTRVNFGAPLPQEDYSLDPPPDGEVRQPVDYRLMDGATVGDRDLFYVYDGANARIIAYQRADGAFVRQWLAPRTGTWAGVLDQVVDMSVGSVADGPPVATLLTPDSVVRVVLE
ncbi:MAG TPA: hypothetical protein VJY85_05755, partial [Candidatus Limnocylindria bacterium]|nr:hypothetical protein [Candidatus Limnocylindria bacterium]